MSDEQPIERRGEDFVLHLDGAGSRYRVTVPKAVLDDEVGEAASEDERRDWIRANMPGILGSVTARETGGFEKAPWGRMVVEELP